VNLKSYICLNQRIFQNILQEHWPYTIKSYIFLLAAKEVPLCGGRDRRVVKYGYSFDTRSHGKITSP